MVSPGPDVLLGYCADCEKPTRLFELEPGHMICLACFRDLVDAAIVISLEDEDAAP